MSPIVKALALLADLGWCAWYGLGYVAVRTPGPAVVPAANVSVADVLAAAGYSGKPRGRVGGS